jgi:glycerol-3-phosphate dehydrogenase (NAD(P)+)
MNENKITVLGAGSWGTTLAILLCDKHDVVLYEYFKDKTESLACDRENKQFLPGIKFPENLKISNDLAGAVKDAFMVIFAVPSFFLRSICESVKDFISEDQILVTVIKGIEDNTFYRMSQIIDTVVTKKRGVVALSGPSHAEEVSRRIPTTIVAACRDLKLAEEVQKVFMRKSFRVYTNEDIVGVELGGATKNIIAIIAGISDGIGFGDNTKAAIITRGMAEMIRLGKKVGANEKTFSGLSGMGDLIVTCQSRHSRNRFVGEQLGKGKKLDEIINSMSMVAEGVKNCKSIYHYAESLGIDMPLTRELYKLLYENAEFKDAIDSLLERKEKHEHWE